MLDLIASPVIPLQNDASQPAEIAVDDLRIGDYLDRHAAEASDRIALRDAKGALTYGQLWQAVDRCSRAMLAVGLQRGDRIAVLAQPRSEAFVTFLAASRLGLVWMGLNPRYQLPELQYAVSDARPVALFGIGSFEGRSYASEVRALRAQASLQHVVGLDEQGEYDASFTQWLSNADRCTDADYLAAQQGVDSSCDALMVYTSGSSGKPKGVLLRQSALLDRSRTQCQQYWTSDYPRVINPFPINHIGGMHYVSMYAFVGGGEVTYAERFKPEDIATLINEGRINVLLTIPTMLHLLVESPTFTPALLDQLEWVGFSGAGMPSRLMQMLFDAKCRVGLTYGMTETAGSVTYCIADRAASNLDEMTHTIGVSVPEGEVRVMNSDGVPCMAGGEGEIQVRAAHCMSGYFERAQANAETFTDDGWMRTGDLGRLRATGHIEFAGRMSEMFKSGGYNVYPKEIEQAMELHPGISAAAVVATKDEVYGETGHAFVCLKSQASLTSPELIRWLASHLANYKIPKKVTFIDEMPLLAVGKVNKRALKELVSAKQ